MGADEGVPCEKSFVGLVAGVTGDPHLAGALKVRRYLGILQHARLGEDADGPGSADIPATSDLVSAEFLEDVSREITFITSHNRSVA